MANHCPSIHVVYSNGPIIDAWGIRYTFNFCCRICCWSTVSRFLTQLTEEYRIKAFLSIYWNTKRTLRSNWLRASPYLGCTDRRINWVMFTYSKQHQLYLILVYLGSYTIELSLRWSETKNLKILIIDSIFSCHLMIMKFCRVTKLGNT